MKSVFSLQDNYNFSQVSGDNNKIHLDDHFTKNLFIKSPIVHGSHIVILALSEFLKRNKKKKYFINYLNIRFNNYLNINKRFTIIFLKNKIFVKTDDLIISEIEMGFIIDKKKVNETCKLDRYYFNNLSNKSIIEELMDLSKYIGSKNPGHGSLILNFKLIFRLSGKARIIQRKISKNIFHFIITRKKYVSNLVVTKPKKIKINFDNFLLNKKSKKKLRGKSILIFGSTGTLGSFAKYFFLKYGAIIYVADRNPKNEIKKKVRSIKINLGSTADLKKIIYLTKPDFVLYFTSPKIKKSYKEKFDNKLYNYYAFYYYVFFKKIITSLNCLNKKVSVFYPSSVALNVDYNSAKFSKEYVEAKRKAEKVFSRKNIKNVKINFYRIDQIQSSQNYNIAGYYEGRSVNILRKHLENFINEY